MIYLMDTEKFDFAVIQFMDLLAEHPMLKMSRTSVMYQGNNLYMQAPPVLEEMTRSNLQIPLFELMGKVPKDVVHVNGTTNIDDKKSSASRKVRVTFKGIADEVTDMDTACGG
jgi:ubiquitin-activating enzyme E1 C